MRSFKSLYTPNNRQQIWIMHPYLTFYSRSTTIFLSRTYLSVLFLYLLTFFAATRLTFFAAARITFFAVAGLDFFVSAGGSGLRVCRGRSRRRKDNGNVVPRLLDNGPSLIGVDVQLLLLDDDAPVAK